MGVLLSLVAAPLAIVAAMLSEWAGSPGTRDSCARGVHQVFMFTSVATFSSQDVRRLLFSNR